MSPAEGFAIRIGDPCCWRRSDPSCGTSTGTVDKLLCSAKASFLSCAHEIVRDAWPAHEIVLSV